MDTIYTPSVEVIGKGVHERSLTLGCYIKIRIWLIREDVLF